MLGPSLRAKSAATEEKKSALGGSSVAGRSHGLDCTAASGSGADQCCSLPDSPGRPCAAKSAPMTR